MKVGIVTTWFERGAAVVSKQYKELLDYNHEVYIYARGGEEYAINDPNWDAPFVHWGKRIKEIKGTWIDLDDFNDWIIQTQIEIIFFNEQQWWPVVLFCKKRGIKIGSYIDYYTEETINYYSLYDFLICNTKRHYEIFNWHKQCYYISWGTNTTLYKPENINKVKDKIVFFHSCGMSPVSRKGTDVLLEAFNLITSDKCHLIIHSQVDLKQYLNPRHLEIVNNLIERNKLTLIIKTIPAPGLYYLGDVYVYPTKLEGIGLTIIEAISSGLPTIVPNHPPMNEFVNDKTGKLITIKNLYSRADGYYWPQCEIDMNSFLDQMIYYINDFKNLQIHKTNARNFAIENFEWKDRVKIVNNAFVNSKIIDYPIIELIENELKAAIYYSKKKNIIERIYRKFKNIF